MSADFKMLTRAEWEKIHSIRQQINKELPEDMQTEHTAGANSYEEYKKLFKQNHT